VMLTVRLHFCAGSAAQGVGSCAGGGVRVNP
jgi:hypothetical protein